MLTVFCPRASLFGQTTVMLPDKNALRTQVEFPNLLSSALLIYRITPRRVGEGVECRGTWSCTRSLIAALNTITLDLLLSHLITHTSQASETHYYPISSPDRRILLHTHNSGPYVPQLSVLEDKTLGFTIYFSGSTGCSAELAGFMIEADWSATLGRWASRYPTTLVSWAIGVVAFVMFNAWGSNDNGHSKCLSVFFFVD